MSEGSLTRAEVEHVARLARLALTDDEIARIADNLAPYFGDGD